MTLVLAVLGPFEGVKELSLSAFSSKVIALVTLIPVHAEAVASTHRTPANDPDGARHCNALDDVHADASIVLLPSRAVWLLASSPHDDPTTVTDRDPVDTMFEVTKLLMLPTSTLQARPRLPIICVPADASIVVPTRTPLAVLHTTLLDAVHVVVVAPLPY